MSSNQGPVRGASRFLAGVPAVLHYHGRDYPCAAHNLSRTGLLLVGEIPWPSDAEVELTVRSAGGDLELRVRGTVQHVDAEPESQATHIGIEFRQVGDPEKVVLESLVCRVIGGQVPAALAGLPAGASEHQIREALLQVAVAQRIALALRAMPKERELLLLDPNPQVLEALVRNPNLLHHEVRSLLRFPTLLPSTLDILARDPKWADEELKILIATHPRTPASQAEKLLSSVSPLGLRNALQRPGLNPDLRLRLARKPVKPPRGR